MIRQQLSSTIGTIVTGGALALTGCSGAAGSGSAAQPKSSAWNPELALRTPGPSTTFGNFGKAIATDGAGYVDVVWLQGGSTDNDGSLIYLGTGAIVFAQSADQGTTWSSAAITGVSPNTGLPKMASADNDIYIVWPAQNIATSNLQVFLLHGVRNGSQVQWGSPTMISHAPMGSNAIFPVVAADQNEVHVAWTDSRNAGVNEVYYTGSIDSGANWSAPIAISPVDGFNSWTPSIAVNAGDVYVAWTDARFGAADCSSNMADCHEVLYLRRSADSGQSWGSETELTCDATQYTYAPSLFADTDSLHIAYFQGMPAPPGPMSLYYLQETTGGSSLAPCSGTHGIQSAVNVSYPAGDVVLSAWRPNISVHAGVVHMVWWGELTNDYSAGQAKVYYSLSADGVNWDRAAALTPQSDGSSYRSFSPNISLSSDGAIVYVIWEDHRNDADALDPNYQVYFRSGRP